MPKQKVSITVKGRVQGVGFRYNTASIARKYGIYGFVKNQVDGSVYIEAEAEIQALNLFIEWCKNGPMGSRVDKTFVNPMPPEGLICFSIK